MSRTISFSLAIALISLTGCSLAKRSPKMYQADTTKMLEARRNDIKACYDGILKTDETAAGTVEVSFILEKETGKLTGAKVKGASAPASVQACVTDALQGLELKPGDADEGQATYTFIFEVGPRPPRSDMTSPPTG
ncbi:MAG: hypothetical protein AAGA56_07700 [Myxococcota bacterium]